MGRAERVRCDTEQRRVLIDQIKRASWRSFTREYSDKWKAIKTDRDRVERIIMFGTVEMALSAVKTFEAKYDKKVAKKGGEKP